MGYSRLTLDKDLWMEKAFHHLVAILILQSLNSLLIKKGEKTSQICAHDRGTSCVVMFLIKFFSPWCLQMPKVGHHHVVHSAAHGRVMIANCCHFKNPQLVVSSGGEYINLICVPNSGNSAKKHCESLC